MSASQATPSVEFSQFKAAEAIFKEDFKKAHAYLIPLKKAKALDKPISSGPHQGKTFFTLACSMAISDSKIDFLLNEGCNPVAAGSDDYKENAFTSVATKQPTFFRDLYARVKTKLNKKMKDMEPLINMRDGHGLTPLITAARGYIKKRGDNTSNNVSKANLETFKSILEKGADIMGLCAQNHNVLWHACDRGQAEIANYLVQDRNFLDKIIKPEECTSILEQISSALEKACKVSPADSTIFLAIKQKLNLKLANLEALKLKKVSKSKADSNETESEDEVSSSQPADDKDDSSDDDVPLSKRKFSSPVATVSSPQSVDKDDSDDDVPLSQRNFSEPATSSIVLRPVAPIITAPLAAAAVLPEVDSTVGASVNKSDKDEKTAPSTTQTQPSTHKRKRTGSAENPSLNPNGFAEPPNLLPKPTTALSSTYTDFSSTQWLSTILGTTPAEPQRKKLKPTREGASSSSSATSNESKSSSTGSYTPLINLAVAAAVASPFSLLSNSHLSSRSTPAPATLPLPFSPLSGVSTTFNPAGMVEIDKFLNNHAVVEYATKDPRFKSLLETLKTQKNASALVALAEYSQQLKFPVEMRMDGNSIARTLLIAGNKLGWDLGTPAITLISNQVKNLTATKADTTPARNFLATLTSIQPSLNENPTIIGLKKELSKMSLTLKH